MKIEFKQKQCAQLPLHDLELRQIISLAIETTKELGWVFGDVNDSGIIAYTNNGLFAWNAEVKVKIINGNAVLISQCKENNFVDITENKKNIERFVSTLNKIRSSVLSTETPSILQHMEMNVA